MALAYSNITVELKEILLKNRPQELFDISPKGTVPVLLVDKSIIIEESLEIMIWALNKNDPNGWYKHNKQKQINIINEYDKKFKYWLDRFKYYDRYPDYDKNYYREKCNTYLSKLDIKLNDTPYLLSKKISLADIAIFPFIRQFANIDLDGFNNFYKNIPMWLEKIMKSKLFLSVMNKFDEYQINQKSLIINFNLEIDN